MSEVRFCGCDRESRSVIFYIVSDPYDAGFKIRITCATCHHPVFIELGTAVESEDISARLDREVSGPDVTYRLKLEAER